MKCFTGILFFIFISTSIFGQQIITSLRADKEWFVGASAGLALPIQGHADDASKGTIISANYGYMFSRALGFQIKAFSLDNTMLETNHSQEGKMKAAGIVFGPMGAIRPSFYTELGFHAMCGISKMEMPKGVFLNEKSSAITLCIGSTFRYKINMLELFCDVDYLTTNPTFDKAPCIISNLTTTLGVAIRFIR